MTLCRRSAVFSRRRTTRVSSAVQHRYRGAILPSIIPSHPLHSVTLQQKPSQPTVNGLPASTQPIQTSCSTCYAASTQPPCR